MNTMSFNKDISALSLNWTAINTALTRSKWQDCMERTNWTAICETASRARMSQTCTAQTCTARLEYTAGGSSLARLLEFEDGTLWIARVQLTRSTPETSFRAQTEVDTMAFLRCTKTPVPRVFALQTDDQNSRVLLFCCLSSSREIQHTVKVSSIHAPTGPRGPLFHASSKEHFTAL